MGVRYEVQADSLLYTVVDDLTVSYQAVFLLPLVDAITGAPLDVVSTVSADLPGVAAQVTDGGLASGAAYVDRVFPDLATKPYSIQLQIDAPGYQSTGFTVNIPIAASLPVVFPALPLRHIPVRLQGRVVKAADRTAVASATVSSKDNKELLLRTPVRFAHLAGVTVKSLSFAPTGPARKVKADVRAGSDRLVLDNNGGLGASAHLQFGNSVVGAIYEVASIGPDPGLVVLNSKLAFGFVAGTPVRELTASAASGTTTLARSSDAGDGVLVVNSALTDKGVEISDGSFTEFHWLNAVSDAAGYYRVNGIAGVKTLELLCNAAGFSVADQPWSPEYSDPINVVDFRLTP